MRPDNSNEPEPTYSFQIPCPTTSDKKIRITKRKVERLIQQRANELSGEDPTKSYLQRSDILNDATWEVGEGVLTVIVPIPVDAQSQLFGEKKRRGVRRPDLFGGRRDTQAKRAVDELLSEVRGVQEVIQKEQKVLAQENLTPTDLASFFRCGANQDLRRLIAVGGEREIEVDGLSMTIVSRGGRQVVQLPVESLIKVSLNSNGIRSGDIRGRILEVRSGSGFLRVGNQVRLGYLAQNDDLRAVLYAARHFRLPVWLWVSQAICVATKKVATLEVTSVVNARQVYEVAAQRSPDPASFTISMPR